jgi:hypothetical protein
MYFRSFLSSLLFGLIILSSCIRQSPHDRKNDREQWNLKGNVKSLSEITYSTNGKYVTNISFNKHGFVDLQSSYNPDGSLIRKWKYQYDKQDKKLTRHCYVRNDSLSYIMHYHCNDQDKITLIRIFSPNGILKSQTYNEYDKSLNIIKETTFGKDTTAIEKEVLHRYNENDKIQEETYLDFILNKKWKQVYKYNSKGLKAEVLYFTVTDSLLNRETYKYNELDQTVEFELYNSNGQLLNSTAYKYDQQGSAIEIVKSFTDGTPLEKQSFKYRYDKHGNFVLLLKFLNDNLETTIERKIKYSGSK